MGKRIVVALGGNALGDYNQEQIEAVSVATKHIADLVVAGNEVVVVHGNGPQVGKIQLAFSAASKVDSNVETMPLPESIAMSQGYIGFHLQNALLNHLRNRECHQGVTTILTQVEVSKLDPSLEKPSKPIGPFYSQEEIVALGHAHYVEDSGRGYRQVVASPSPLNIVEIEEIKSSLSNGNVVICCGGGGVPVVTEGKEVHAIDGVIDKDAASALLAQEIDADLLLILTAVENVSLNFRKENELKLTNVSSIEMETYLEEGHFAAGSMLPKILAAKKFVDSGTNKRSVITSLECALDAVSGQKGTIITK